MVWEVKRVLKRTRTFAMVRHGGPPIHTAERPPHIRWLRFAEGIMSGSTPRIHREWFSVRPSPVINSSGDQQNNHGCGKFGDTLE